MEQQLQIMQNTVKNLNNLLSIIREDDYLVIEHEIYGHIVELHLEDFPFHKELLRDALEFAANSVPW